MLESWPEIAHAVGLAGAQVMSSTVDGWGWRARFRLARGQTIRDVIAKIPAIESGLGTFGAPSANTRRWTTWPTAAFTMRTHIHASDDDLKRGRQALAKIHKVA
jgi:hypothetical protein